MRMLLSKGNGLGQRGNQTENSTSHYDVFTKTLWLGDEDPLSREDKRRLGAICEYAGRMNRVQSTAKNFSELCHGCAVPAAMRQLSIWSSRPSSLPRDSRTNKSAGVFCFAKRLIKRVPRRNRTEQRSREEGERSDRFYCIPRGKNSLLPSRNVLK